MFKTFTIMVGNTEDPVYIKTCRSITMSSNFPDVQKLELYRKKAVLDHQQVQMTDHKQRHQVIWFHLERAVSFHI